MFKPCDTRLQLDSFPVLLLAHGSRRVYVTAWEQLQNGQQGSCTNLIQHFYTPNPVLRFWVVHRLWEQHAYAFRRHAPWQHPKYHELLVERCWVAWYAYICLNFMWSIIVHFFHEPCFDLREVDALTLQELKEVTVSIVIITSLGQTM